MVCCFNDFISFSQFRYVPAALTRFEKAIKRHPRATLRLTNEFRTSKLCHVCYGILASPTGWSKHRWKCCHRCRLVFNRDTNAAFNILTRGLAKDYPDLGHGLPIQFKRDVSMVFLLFDLIFKKCLF